MYLEEGKETQRVRNETPKYKMTDDGATGNGAASHLHTYKTLYAPEMKPLSRLLILEGFLVLFNLFVGVQFPFRL